MKKLITYLILFFILFKVNTAFAQQLPIYSQYMMNRFLINPSMAGAEGYTSFNLTMREQWLGLDNAPRTQALSGQTRLIKNSHISKRSSVRRKRRRSSKGGNTGIGAYIYNDANGIIRRTGTQLSYAYHLNTRTSQISFGLAATGYQFAINPEKLILIDVDDQIFTTKNSVFVPDASFGFYFVNQKIDIGFSALQLFESAIKIGDTESNDNNLYRHFYLHAGFRHSPRRDIIIEPNMLLTLTTRSFQADIGTRIFYNQSYWGGLTFRTSGSGSADVILQGGVKVNNFLFGYSFDLTLSSIRKYSLGSHEIMMAIKIGDNARRYRWLNRY